MNAQQIAHKVFPVALAAAAGAWVFLWATGAKR